MKQRFRTAGICLTLALLIVKPTAANGLQTDAPAWAEAMREIHKKFSGQPGTLAHFGDSITVSLAYWTRLSHEPRRLSPELADDLKLVQGYQRQECWREWRGPKFGNEGGMTIRWAHDNIDARVFTTTASRCGTHSRFKHTPA